VTTTPTGPRHRPQLPPRFATPNNETAPLYGGPAAGQTVTRRRGHNWPRFLDSATGQNVPGSKGEALLRHRLDDGVYLAAAMPVAPSVPVTTAFVHSSACVERGLTWWFVAVALAGSHAGRVLANGSNDPADVLDALINNCDDLIRARTARDRPRNAAETSAERSDR
jgi:hypothetical protein